jgi:hypothetical protein
MEENLLMYHRYEFAESTTSISCEEDMDIIAATTTGGTTIPTAGKTTTLVLSLEEMERIASLNRGYRFFRPEDWWKENPVPVFH